MCKIVFVQNFVKFPPTLIIFLAQNGNEDKIMRGVLIVHLN